MNLSRARDVINYVFMCNVVLFGGLRLLNRASMLCA
jgi:hypothetical protein